MFVAFSQSYIRMIDICAVLGVAM